MLGCLLPVAACLVPWIAGGVTWAVTGSFAGGLAEGAAGWLFTLTVIHSCYRWDMDHGA